MWYLSVIDVHKQCNESVEVVVQEPQEGLPHPHHEDEFYEPHNKPARDSNMLHHHYSDYELMHHHYRMHVGHHPEYDETQAVEYENPAQGYAHAQPEHPQDEVPASGGQQAEEGELPPQESLRIHHMRRRTPPAVETDPAEEQETLS